LLLSTLLHVTFQLRVGTILERRPVLVEMANLESPHPTEAASFCRLLVSSKQQQQRTHTHGMASHRYGRPTF
jgi:hypothetical protein